MSWYREQAVKATRKPHSCAGCHTLIAACGPALYVSCLSDYGDGPFFGYYHHDCREAENALNTLHSCYADEDWICLCEIDAEDHDWLRSAFPAVAARVLPTPPATSEAGATDKRLDEYLNIGGIDH